MVVVWLVPTLLSLVSPGFTYLVRPHMVAVLLAPTWFYGWSHMGVWLPHGFLSPYHQLTQRFPGESSLCEHFLNKF
jgi:hypothetical protein